MFNLGIYNPKNRQIAKYRKQNYPDLRVYLDLRVYTDDTVIIVRNRKIMERIYMEIEMENGKLELKKT